MTDRFTRLFNSPTGATAHPRSPPFLRGSISEQVAQRLMALIKAGHIQAGDRLPTESQMTVALGIGRPALREALKALTLMGILESRQGGRYTVTDLSPLRLFVPFNIMLSSSNYFPAEHYEARSAVEIECVRLCTTRAEPEHRTIISSLAEKGPSSVNDPEAFGIIDEQFHGAIYAGSGNRFLEPVARALYTVGLDIRRTETFLPSMIARSCEEHKGIARAIELRDADMAVEAYRVHLLTIRDTAIYRLAAQREKHPA